MDLEELGRVLRERREALGMPKAALARRAGISSGYVWLVERAVPRTSGTASRPSERTLRRWAAVLAMGRTATDRLLLLAGHRERVGDMAVAPFGGALTYVAADSDNDAAIRDDFDGLLKEIQALTDAKRAAILREMVASFVRWLQWSIRAET